MFGLFGKKKKKKVEEPKKTALVKPVVEEKPVVVEEEKPVVVKEEKPVVVKEEKPEKTIVAPVISKEKDASIEVSKVEEKSKKPARKMPYHITKHSDGGWQIKRGKAKKALKLFDTQKEAIEYAKVLEKEKGESYIIHKANGTTRKKTYN